VIQTKAPYLLHQATGLEFGKSKLEIKTFPAVIAVFCVVGHGSMGQMRSNFPFGSI
jgi:hypothetical protein